LSFLNPAILYGLAAASLPLLIHLFSRSKSKVVPFSNLGFLKRLQREKIRHLRIRQLLLILIRTAVILCLVLAFARPTLRSSAVSADAQTSAAIILDNSYSMEAIDGGQRLFEKARSTASAALDLFQAGDEVLLIAAADTGDASALVPFHNFDLLGRLIERQEINLRRADLSAALARAAYHLQRSSNLNREIYLISDLQRTAFSAFVELGDLRLFVLPVACPDPANLAVETSALISTILEKGRLASLQGDFVNRGTSPSGNRLAQLYVEGEKVAQSTLSLSPGDSLSREFKFVLNRSGLVAGQLTLEDEHISVDNTRYFVMNVPEQIHVALAGTGTAILNLALDPVRRGGGLFRIDTIEASDLRPGILDRFDVLVLSNLNGVDGAVVADYLDNGGGLMLVLGPAVDLKFYNNRLGPRIGIPSFTQVLSGDQFSLGEIDFTHDVFKGIFNVTRPDFERPRFNFGIRTEAIQGTIPIMRYGNGDLFLFEQHREQGRVLVLTSGWQAPESDFSQQAIFAPLMSRCIGYLGSSTGQGSNHFLVGETLDLILDPSLLDLTLQLHRPDRRVDRVRPRLSPAGPRLEYDEVDRPGIYKLYAGDEMLAQWAVNVDVRESDLRPLETGHLVDRYGAIIIDPPDRAGQIVREERIGRELWALFALFALILVVLEMILYREKGEVPLGTEAVT